MGQPVKILKMNSKAKQTILDAYGLKDLTSLDRRRDTIDAKKLFVKWAREEEDKTYHVIADELERTHCAAIHLYRGSEWLIKTDPKAQRVWKVLTNKRRCAESLEEMALIMDGIEDQEVYKYVIEKLPLIIKSKINFDI
tara:strand:+ start:653 stop:1069 length:417 start_codon:yes stop_codon:yes gene_type:complete